MRERYSCAGGCIFIFCEFSWQLQFGNNFRGITVESQRQEEISGGVSVRELYLAAGVEAIDSAVFKLIIFAFGWVVLLVQIPVSPSTSSSLAIDEGSANVRDSGRVIGQ